MKKVFVMAAMVLMGTMGSWAGELASATAPSEVNSCPVKKTTTKKKTTTTKKSTNSKTATAQKSTTTATATSTADASAQGSTQKNLSSSSVVGGILGAVLGGNNTTSSSTASSASSSSAGSGVLGSILGKVLGTGKLTQQSLIATWKYSKPGCAFTSENLLAKAGGEIAANTIENKLSAYYQKVGFKSSNTYFTFKDDGTFSAKIDGKSWNGKYTLDEKTGAIQLNGLLLKLNGYVTNHSNGISLLFESKKLLTLVQTLTALSGNSTLGALGNLSKNYDGVRVGFELVK